MASLEQFIANIVTHIINPIVGLLFALALVLLLWGGAMFIFQADDPKARETGRRHLLYGVLGMFIMVFVIAILSVVTSTFCGSSFCR
jgi:hypothetical protein